MTTIKKIIHIVALVVTICFGFAFEYHNTSPNSQSEFWIRTDYLTCLKNYLPCECEKKTNGIYIIQFNKNKQGSEFLFKKYKDMEFSETSVTKQLNKYIISHDNPGAFTKAGFFIRKDTLYFSDSLDGTRTFINIKERNFKNRERLLFAENYQMLNDAFIKRGHPGLSKTLQRKNIECYCDKWQGGVDMLRSDSLYWILKQDKDTVSIYKEIDTNSFLTVPRQTIKKKIKSFFWPKR